MIERDLKKMSRTELLELLLEQSRQLEAAQQELEQTRQEQEIRRLELTDGRSQTAATIFTTPMGIFHAVTAPRQAACRAATS